MPAYNIFVFLVTVFSIMTTVRTVGPNSDSLITGPYQDRISTNINNNKYLIAMGPAQWYSWSNVMKLHASCFRMCFLYVGAPAAKQRCEKQKKEACAFLKANFSYFGFASHQFSQIKAGHKKTGKAPRNKKAPKQRRN